MSQVKWNVEHLKEIDSTNTWLAARARTGAPAGLVLVSDYQSAGRGRRDRHWSAAPGTSLLCSALLEVPQTTPPQWLMVAAALSVCDAIEELSDSRPALKWPNDVLFGELKIAGLLADVITTNNSRKVVVGLGLNLTEVDPEFESASTVLAHTGRLLSPLQVLDRYLSALSVRIDLFDSPVGMGELSAQYERALSTLGRKVRVELIEGTVHGRAIGVDHEGALRVETDGEVRTFRAGDVVHLRREDDE